jgi:nitric oxide reductase NorQ protein
MKALSANGKDLVELSWFKDARLLVEEHRLVLLVGEPGVGKTTFALHEARRVTSQEAQVLSGSPETELAHLFGMWTLAGEETRFADGPLPRALKDGSWLLVEELSLIPVECRAALLPLRGQGRITNPLNGESLAIPAAFRLIATSNPETMRCRRSVGIVGALYDDFLIMEVPVLSNEKVADLLRHHFPRASAQRIDSVLKLWEEYRQVRRSSDDLVACLSYRAAAHLLALLERGMSRETAIQVALVNKFIADRDMHATAKLKRMVS